MVCPNCNAETDNAFFCRACDVYMADPSAGAKAGVARRLAAQFLDGICIWVAFFVVMLLGGIVGGIGGGADRPAIGLGLSFGAFFFAAVGYIIFSLWFLAQGKTPGKWLVGIRAVDKSNGGSPGLGRMLVRETVGKFASGLFLGLGYFWAIWDRDTQAWHDKIAGTLVLRNRIVPGVDTLQLASAPAQIDYPRSAQGDPRKSEPVSIPVLTSAVVPQEAPPEVTRPTTASILEEPFKPTGAKVVPIEPHVSMLPVPEAAEQAAPTAALKRPQWLLFVGAVVIALAVGGIALWYFVLSSEARISRAIDRGDLVTPVGQSAFAIYERSKPDLSVSARTRLREKALNKLLAAAESLVLKRTQGEGLSQLEIQQLTSLYDWAVDLAPGDVRALAGQRYALGMSALLSGKPRAALPLLLESTKYNQNSAPAFNELGRTYVKLNDHYHAAEAYKRAIALDPNWVFPQVNLGGVYLQDKQWDSAEQSYLRATQLDATLATPWYFLGQVCEVQKRFGDAVNAYEKALQLAATRPSSAFKPDAVRQRIEMLKPKVTATGPAFSLGQRVAELQGDWRAATPNLGIPALTLFAAGEYIRLRIPSNAYFDYSEASAKASDLEQGTLAFNVNGTNNQMGWHLQPIVVAHFNVVSADELGIVFSGPLLNQVSNMEWQGVLRKVGAVAKANVSDKSESGDTSSPPLDLNGFWSGWTRPSMPVGLTPGSMFLEQHPDGSVNGSWNHRGIVEGSIEGTLQANILTYRLRRVRFDPGGKGWGDEADTSTVQNCPGTFSGTITFLSDTASGSFGGGDCRGTIQDAVLTLKRCDNCKAPGHK